VHRRRQEQVRGILPAIDCHERGVGRLEGRGTGSILAYDIPREAPRGKLKPRVVIDGKLKAPSGFAVGPDGDLYVAERFDQRVRRFSAKGRKKGTFIDGLPDMPEFLVHIPERR
jgi:hypothetical protein